jgi:hypothetical protein
MSFLKIPFVRAIIMAVCFNLCCYGFTQNSHIIALKAFPSIGTRYRAFDNKSIFPSIGNQSVIRKRHCKKNYWSHHEVATTKSDIDDTRRWRFSWTRLPILERSHEKIISLVFGGISAAILHFAYIQSQTDGLPPMQPGKWLTMAETGLALSWSSMIVAISFLEAWTKFRAPFLKKYIAVDVGRHVFAALNSAELGLAASFWMHRLFICSQVQTIVGGGLFHKSRSYYAQFTFTLPATATILLLSQVLLIAPKLYRRAKRRILDGFEDALPSVKIALSNVERAALIDIAQDLRRSKKIPSRLWHSVYALLEIAKIGCLNSFVILSWLNVLK